MNVVTININGMEYNLKGEENEEYLHKVASYVDKKFKNIQDINGKLSTSQAAVLTALNVTDERFKIDYEYEEMKKSLQKLKAEKKTYENEISKLNSELIACKEENKVFLDRINNNINDKYVKKQEIIIKDLKQKLEAAEKDLEKKSDKISHLSKESTELKYQLKTSKNKVMDLQNKLIENAIDLAKTKKSMDEYKKENDGK